MKKYTFQTKDGKLFHEDSLDYAKVLLQWGNLSFIKYNVN
jgi:hypothetical protein